MDEILELLRLYGRNVHSFEVLEPGLRYWFTPDRRAAVAYVDRGFYRVAAGGPLCPRERLAEVAWEFGQEAHRQHRKAAFFGVSGRFIQALDQRFDWLQLAAQPCWDPRSWSLNSKVRNRVRKAEKAGLSVRRADPLEVTGALRPQVDRLLRVWERQHPLPPMRFMVTLDVYGHASEKLYLVAEQDGVLRGLAAAVPIYALQGWLLEDLILDRQAAPGAAELLIDRFMREVGGLSCPLASLGMVALAGAGNDPRHPVLALILRSCYRLLDSLYSFQGLYRFRSKLNPGFWEPVYVAACGPVTWMTIRAVLMAFAGGWVPAFAARALGWRLGKRSG